MCSRNRRLDASFHLRIRVGKMRADVAQPRGAQQGVAKGVRQRVAIGMADGPFVKWEFDAAEDQLAAFGEAMQVVSDPRAGHRPARSWRR